MMPRRPLPRFSYIQLILLATMSLPAGAATFTVTNLNDSGTGSLRQAILDANNQPGADTIVFAPGLSGILPIVSRLEPTGVLDLVGPGASVLTILGNGTTVFNIPRSDAIITISGLTITNGDDGIYNWGTLIVNNCHISKNFGSGIVTRENTSLTVNNSILSENNEDGIHNYYGSATVNNSTSSDNAKRGIYSNRGEITLNNSTLSGNRDRGLINDYGSFTVNHSTIVNNLASSYWNTAGGGGILSWAAPSLTIINNTLFGNEARGWCGGAVYIGSSTNNTLYNNTLSGNLAGNGGGLCIGRNSILNPLNNTLSANTATSLGGGIYIEEGSTLLPGNNVVAGNNTTPGGDSGIEIYNAGTFSSRGRNLFGRNGVSGLTNATPAADDRILAGAISTAIAPLTDNGGPTATHLPVTGSPAIDAGNNALVPTDVTTDQRGYGPRIVGNAVDIGAVEVGAAADPATTLITHYYVSILGREPDTDGLAYWKGLIDTLQQEGGDAKPVFRDMAYFFFNSPEYLGNNTSNTEFIYNLYRTFFQREPDEEGLAFWLNQLALGVSRNQVMSGFLYSPEFTAFMQNLGF
jgi:hypothetical protein